MPRKARRRNLEIFGARIIFFARLQPGIGHNRQGVRAENWPGKSMLARRWLKKARGGRHDDAPTAASEASPLGPLPYLKRAPLRTFEHTGNPARPRRTGELPDTGNTGAESTATLGISRITRISQGIQPDRIPRKCAVRRSS